MSVNTTYERKKIMIHVAATKKTFWDIDVEGYIFLLPEGFKETADLRKVENEFYPNLLRVLKRHNFVGKRGQTFLLTGNRDGNLVQLLFVGLGALEGVWDTELEHLRRSIGKIVHRLKKLEVKDAVLKVPVAGSFGIDQAELVKQIAIAAYLADYEFVTFKTDKKDKKWDGDLFLAGAKSGRALSNALQEAVIIAGATNASRQLIDFPANIVTPTYLANHAKKVAKEWGLKSKVFGRAEAERRGMGGFCAVDAGSDQDGKFIVLEYAAPSKKAPTIALVGKGVTFDTGGISLKPSDRMHGMKYDMSGAAAVVSVMEAVAQLRPRVNVIGIMPTVENMPSGKAGRQDDIITFMNGKTAEIKSTDAEGRLILADGLCYAEKHYKPDVVIDIATLTGACVVALGHFYAGLMTADQKLTEKLREASSLTGDKVWPLPFDEDYEGAIKSPVADIANIGSRKYHGSTITAGRFLRHFVEKTPWAHLDIAGTASDVPGVSYLGDGATGATVRLLVEFITAYKK